MTQQLGLPETRAVPALTGSRVVLAHDYLTQFGGAERVALSMTRAFPQAPLLTSFYDPERTFAGFGDVKVVPSGLNRVGLLRDDPRRALPLLAFLWDRVEAPEADVVLCSSSGWSHGVRTEARKIVYCHNPARWLYQPEDYRIGTGRGAMLGLRTIDRRLRAWDLAAARTAHTYVANSQVVARRIARTYGVEAQVLHPPVMVDLDAPREPVPGLPDDFFLVVGRTRGYKNVSVTVEAFAAMPDLHLVVVGAHGEDGWPANVHAVPVVSEPQLRHLYAHARTLVATAHEDFGLTVIEAGAFGTPAIALASGGYLETVREGVSGRFFAEPTVEAVRRAVRAELAEPTDRDGARHNASRFGEHEFHRRLRELVDAG